jgi:DNA-binding transcriptional ArsR family regulator
MPITDPMAIRALAHPLRLDLLDLLAATGPATAAQCGRTLGVSQASCSFHLRQLSKYGLVEDAGPGSDRRERQWRVPNPRPVLRVNGLTGGDRVIGREFERIVVERETGAILDHLDTGEPGAKFVSAIALVSPEEADELRTAWKALIEPYLDRAARPGHRPMRMFMAATPLPDPSAAPASESATTPAAEAAAS